MNKDMLAEMLFPKINKDIKYYDEIYPRRNLKEGQIVSRFAPSPTGFVHMGSLYTSFVAGLFPHQTGGVFFLRIEDTDKKREVENGIKGIVDDLKDYSITFDEGESYGGNYGPYIQSQRKEIYQTFIKHLVKNDLAYPCFCTEDEIDTIRKVQEENKDRIGYYGKWATCRHLSDNEIKQKLDNHEEFIIRLKSPGNFSKTIVHHDLIKGKVEFPENDLDIVLMKSDGLPLYHFAHLVDDYLMGTTHVIRGDEWLSSIPVHLQLFEVFGYKAPKYAHLAPIMKDDNGSKRKLSKRHDPEAAISYYHEKGIPQEAVKIYLATLANTNFEEWYNQNTSSKIEDFKFSFSKMNISGALFDLAKLNNISRLFFSRLTSQQLYDGAINYYQEFDSEFLDLMKKNKDYFLKILDIERYIPKPRKDISSYEDVKKETWYMFDEIFYQIPLPDLYKEVIIENNYELSLLEDYVDNYFSQDDDKETWFNKIKTLCTINGYAPETKLFKENPQNYKGHVGHVSELIRLALTSRTKTPDLYELSKLIGRERMKKRFEMFIDYIKSNKK